MFSEPAVGVKFFGREDVLELLNKRVLALKDGYRQNIALTGQSLSGKSSIILHFLHLIREEGFLPIYVEVVREAFGSFAHKFIATMLYNALKLRGVDPLMDFEKLLAKAREQRRRVLAHGPLEGLQVGLEEIEHGVSFARRARLRGYCTTGEKNEAFFRVRGVASPVGTW